MGQLFPNIVSTLAINSRFPTLEQHLTDRHSRQSVMISAWVTFWHSLNCLFKILKFFADKECIIV